MQNCSRTPISDVLGDARHLFGQDHFKDLSNELCFAADLTRVAESYSLETKSIGWIMIARSRLESTTRPIAATSLSTVVEFTSYRPLNLRAGESDVPELPLAHPMKLNDPHPLDSAGEV